ncbi:hypothetical protein thsrh120_63620 [Rhizobium sp. No.120]
MPRPAFPDLPRANPALPPGNTDCLPKRSATTPPPPHDLQKPAQKTNGSGKKRVDMFVLKQTLAKYSHGRRDCRYADRLRRRPRLPDIRPHNAASLGQQGSDESVEGAAIV